MTETKFQPKEHLKADWLNRLKDISHNDNNSLTFVVGLERISFNKSILCFLSPVLDKLIREIGCSCSISDHIYVTLCDQKCVKSLKFLKSLLQSGIIEQISAADAENLPSLFALLDLNISFDAIAAEAIFPKIEVKQEATQTEIEMKIEEVKSETGEDTEYVEMEDEVNMKIEVSSLSDSLPMDHSPGSSSSPLADFQYSIVTPWFVQQQRVESEELNFGQPSLFSDNRQYPEIFSATGREFQNITELEYSGLVDENTMPGWMKGLRGVEETIRVEDENEEWVKPRRGVVENEEWAKTIDSFQSEYGLN